VFEREGGYASSGDGSATNWLRRTCHLPGFEADRQMKLARQLDDLGDTQKAVESGQIGMEHALEIARATDDIGLGAEGELLEVAVQKDPGQMRHVPTIGGRRPHLMVIVHEETLAGTPGSPPAQLEGAGPISVRGVVSAGFARRREGGFPP
jgi:hypothetical protein